MVASGMIQPSKARYTNPLVPVQKKDGSLRLCLDFRLLNEKIRDDRYPLPHTDTILHRLGRGNFFSCLDPRQGYHQIPLTKENREMTAFSTPNGRHEFKTLPFGLKDALASFQRITNQLLTG